MRTFECAVHALKGLDTKAAMQLAREAQKYTSVIIVLYMEKKANVKNVMELVSLKAGQGAELIFAIDGDDEAQAEEGLKALCRHCFPLGSSGRNT